MEQAVNQFNKGLQSDTHPIVQGNDTLSDALNATFVTMNGNEVVLQNDMGNRRVDNAFLPSGYEPVGIKEYGGIIYVASYNPITNRGQIGSFPSPERKINCLDDESLGCEFELFDHFYEPSSDSIKFIKSDVALIPLTSDTSLHAGDKFAIYSDQISNWGEYLTNYYNTFYDKIITPKNRHLTLSIGILNSQNQFVDITKNLKRWDKDGNEIKYEIKRSEDYIFNDGYFISKFKIDDNSKYTQDDRDLIRERQVVTANTYAYKLVGPLYLKVQLNHIQEFSFDVSGDKESIEGSIDNKITLYITADITYNCPDTADYGTSNSSKYQFLNDGKITDWSPFDFYIRQSGNYVKETSRIQSVTFTNPVYDYDTGLYKTKATMKWVHESFYGDDYNTKLYYFIGVDSGIPQIDGKPYPYYIETLSTYGSVDITKLGSGEINLKSFRFFNNDESTTITYVLEAYPKINQKFNSISMTFVNVMDPVHSFTYNNLPVNNGKNIVTIDWENKIESRQLYKVYITAYDNTKGYNLDNRWFLSTKLFNDCYNPQSQNFVEDFGPKIYTPADSEYNSSYKILYDKLRVKLKLETNHLSRGIITKGVTNGNPIEDSSKKYIKYYSENSYELNETINDYLEIDNKDLYPEGIYIETSSPLIPIKEAISKKDFEIEITSNGNEVSVEDDTKLKLNFNDGNTTVDESIDLVEITDQQVSNNTITGKIALRDGILSRASSKTINKGFVKVHSLDFKNTILKDDNISKTGFFVTNYDEDNELDDHVIALVINHNSWTVPFKQYANVRSENINSPNYIKTARFYYEAADSEKHKSFDDDEIMEMYNLMNNIIEHKYTFAYLFYGMNRIGNFEDGYTGRYVFYTNNKDKDSPTPYGGVRPSTVGGYDKGIQQTYCPVTSCKVWWRNSQGTWTLLNSSNGGVFGGDSHWPYLYTFPASITNNNNKAIYVGNDNWSDNNYEKKGNLYNNLFLSDCNGVDGEKLLPQIPDIYADSTDNNREYYKGINDIVKRQIMDFIDPQRQIVFCLYKTLSLSTLNKVTLNQESYIYNKPYSGNINLHIDYDINNWRNSYIDITFKKKFDEIKEILPFKFYKSDGEELLLNGVDITIPIKSNFDFEDSIAGILYTDVINGMYINNSTVFTNMFKDSDNNELSETTIYKDDGNGKLIPIYDNLPFKVDNMDDTYNTLICNKSDSNSSSNSSRYLKANGDNHSNTTLEFAGEHLKVVNYTQFRGL